MTFRTRTTFACLGVMVFLLSAVLGDLSTRLMSGLINFFIKKSSRPTASEDDLQRALLRAQVITEEAMGRCVTNHAMLLQLDNLREAMHLGCYKLDTFRYQSHEDSKKQVRGHFASLSKVNSAKGLFSSHRDSQNLDELQEVLEKLRSVILDANELVQSLTSYPWLYHQPYSMHLLLEKCMFGRQMEAELVINFLLNTQPHCSRELEILPIIGPSKVGKSTLVAHVCNDERVRDHFSEIVFMRDHFTGDELTTFREGSGTRQQNWLPKSNKGGRRFLFVVELAENIDKDSWNKLNSICVPSGSKLIVTSRSEKIAKFGTTQPLTLKYLSHEAYWYFFKTLMFGSTDPEMHPWHAYVAMEICRLLDGTLFRANFAANFLRDNFDIRIWCKHLAFLRVLKHVSRSGEHLFNVEDQNRPACFRRMLAPSKDFVMYHQYHQHHLDGEVPSIGIHDVVFGDLKPRGKFEVLVWRSHLPPYHSYIYICEIQELNTIGVKRKRL